MEHPIFWAPEVSPLVLRLQRIPAGVVETSGQATTLRIDFSGAEVRHAEDGWYVLLSASGMQHRLWLDEPPDADASYAAVIALDERFAARSKAAESFWRGLTRPATATTPVGISAQQRTRLTEAMRALDAHQDGASYRAIAQGLFGAVRMPERAWKTHDLRSRTIRLVKAGLDLMRSGYRRLLFFRNRDK